MSYRLPTPSQTRSHGVCVTAPLHLHTNPHMTQDPPLMESRSPVTSAAHAINNGSSSCSTLKIQTTHASYKTRLLFGSRQNRNLAEHAQVC